MDKVGRIKQLVESSLDTSFGGDISIAEIVVLPTQKFDDMTNKWIPDSHTIFVSIKRNTPVQPDNYLDVRQVTNLIEGLLGFEVCIDFL
jgi:hypothetical protein